jgi:plasmid stabilization system protein ParE
VDQFHVELDPMAIRDLQEIDDYVSARAGSIVAERYVDHLQDACEALAYAPERGVLRRDLGEVSGRSASKGA